MQSKKNILLSILNYNNAVELNNYLSKLDKALDFVDVLIFDNASSDDSIKIAKNYAQKNNSIKFIESDKNLGSAGGFNKIVQYFLDNKDYRYVILSEEDCTIKNDDIIINLTKAIKPETKIVKARFKERETISFDFHFTLYRRDIFEQVGNIGINLFSRGDDYEWGKRYNTYIANNEKEIINDYYSHDILKSGFSSISFYFSLRNCFLTTRKNGFLNKIIYFYLHILLSLNTLIIQKNNKLLILCFKAFYDAYLNKNTMECINENALNNLKSNKIVLEKNNNDIFKTSIINFNKNFCTYNFLTNTLNPLIKRSIKLKNGFKFIILKENTILSFFLYLFKKCIIIDAHDKINEEFSYYKNKNFSIFNFFVCIFNMIISLIICVLLTPVFFLISPKKYK